MMMMMIMLNDKKWSVGVAVRASLFRRRRRRRRHCCCSTLILYVQWNEMIQNLIENGFQSINDAHFCSDDSMLGAQNGMGVPKPVCIRL